MNTPLYKVSLMLIALSIAVSVTCYANEESTKIESTMIHRDQDQPEISTDTQPFATPSNDEPSTTDNQSTTTDSKQGSIAPRIIIVYRNHGHYECSPELQSYLNRLKNGIDQHADIINHMQDTFYVSQDTIAAKINVFEQRLEKVEQAVSTKKNKNKKIRALKKEMRQLRAENNLLKQERE